MDAQRNRPRGGERSRTSQEVHRRRLLCQPIPCFTSLIMRTFHTTPETLHRERGEDAGSSMSSRLNNDVGSKNRGAHHSPWSLGSRPVTPLVRAPVSNETCQRLCCGDIMTYHTSSLRPHTDNYNHVCGFGCRVRLLLEQIDAAMRDGVWGGGGGGVNDGAGTEVWRILAPSRRRRTDDKKKKRS